MPRAAWWLGLRSAGLLLAIGMLLMLAVARPVITVDPTFLTYLFGTICPILVAILAKQSAPPAVKAILNAALACLAALLALAIKEQGHIDLYGWGVSFAQALIAAWASYNGFWKHTVTPTIEAKTANFGIGPSARQAA